MDQLRGVSHDVARENPVGHGYFAGVLAVCWWCEKE